MNNFTNHLTVKGGGYNTPSIDVVSIEVEAGFEASLPGVTIDPWTKDEDTLEF